MSSRSKKITSIILWVSILLVFFLQFHNLLTFPLQRGLDAGAHLEYITYLKKFMKVPLAYEGWELYQPPLYYLLVAPLSTLLGIKLFGLFVWSISEICIYVFFNRAFKDKNIALIGTAVTSSLPVILYLSFAVSNEFFSGVLIGLSLIFYSCYFDSSKPIHNLLLGLLLGIAFLAKATGFVLIAALILDQLIKSKFKIMKLIGESWLTYSIAFLVSGWYYLRNCYFFGGPFISSYDFPKLFPLHQTIVPRTLTFFLTLKGFFTFDLFRSHHYSFLSGTYFSWFYDGHNIIVPVQEFSKIGGILIILSIPIFIFFLIGFIKEFRVKNRRQTVFLLYIVLLFIGYVGYNFRLPYYSTVKGVFLVSSVVPFGYFVLKGLIPFRKYILFISLYILVYVLVILKNFWIMPHWYPKMISL